jgi:hypothetical protein
MADIISFDCAETMKAQTGLHKVFLSSFRYYWARIKYVLLWRFCRLGTQLDEFEY